MHVKRNILTKNITDILQKILFIGNIGSYKIISIFGIFTLKINRTEKIQKKCVRVPIRKNKIVLLSGDNKTYSCNPKYITEEIIRRNLQYDLVWLLPKYYDLFYHVPEGIKVVNVDNWRACLKELSEAHIWIDNNRKNRFFDKGLIKKEGQFYIQTWHGSLGIKRICKSRPWFSLEKTNKFRFFASKPDDESVDFVISNSNFDDLMFSDFFFNCKVIKLGHPRCDVFFLEEDKKRRIHERVHSVLGIPNDVKIVAYMPTFRDTGRIDCYDIDFESLVKTLEVKFGGKWVIVVKVHPKIKVLSKEIFRFSENIIDVSRYPDTQELLSVVDVCITDYSSCIFDFMLTRRPGFIFATDIEMYNNERGFYYPLETTPFPIATTNEELASNILNFDEKKYKSDVEEFLKEKGCIEDGHSSERVVDLIEKLMAQ